MSTYPGGVGGGGHAQPHAAQLLHEVEVLRAELALVVREGDVAASHALPYRLRHARVSANIKNNNLKNLFRL